MNELESTMTESKLTKVKTPAEESPSKVKMISLQQSTGLDEEVTKLPIANVNPFRVSPSEPPADPDAKRCESPHVQAHSVYAEAVAAVDWNYGHEPQLEDLKAMIFPYAHHGGLDKERLEVEFLSEGNHNKIYTVCSKDQHGETHKCILRLQLPIDPHYKTESEVATMEYVRRNTSIPVPQIYAYDSSGDNCLRLEWILMEFMPGQQLVDESADDGEVEKAAANWMDQLSRARFDKIGSLYADFQCSPTVFRVGKLVDWRYRARFHLKYGIESGPFSSVRQYIEALLRVALRELEDKSFLGVHRLYKPNDDGSPSDLELKIRDKFAECIKEVLETLPLMISDSSFTTDDEFSPVIFHNSLHGRNILVCDGKVSALLDWERAMIGSPKHLMSDAAPYPLIYRQFWRYDESGRIFNDALRELESPWLTVLAHCAKEKELEQRMKDMRELYEGNQSAIYLVRAWMEEVRREKKEEWEALKS